MYDTTSLILPVLCISSFLGLVVYFWIYGNHEAKIPIHHDPPFERRNFKPFTPHEREEAAKQRAVDYWAEQWEAKKRGENHHD
jgi:hypothetical protein